MSGRRRKPRARARPRSRSTSSRTRPSRSWPAQAAGRDGTIFRSEALESRARDRRAPEIEIYLDTAWIRRLYRLALGLVAAGIVVVMTVKTVQCDYGTSVITEPGDRFAALLPAAALPDLTRSRDLDVVLELPSSRAVRVTWAQVQLAGPNLVRRAGLAPPAQPSILVTGRLTAGTAASAGRAARKITPMKVIVGSEPVAALLADEFQVMLGIRGAGS